MRLIVGDDDDAFLQSTSTGLFVTGIRYVLWDQRSGGTRMTGLLYVDGSAPGNGTVNGVAHEGDVLVTGADGEYGAQLSDGLDVPGAWVEFDGRSKRVWHDARYVDGQTPGLPALEERVVTVEETLPDLATTVALQAEVDERTAQSAATERRGPDVYLDTFGELGTANDTAVVMAALNQIKNNGGGRLICPRRGLVTIPDLADFDLNVDVEIDGRECTFVGDSSVAGTDVVFRYLAPLTITGLKVRDVGRLVDLTPLVDIQDRLHLIDMDVENVAAMTWTVGAGDPSGIRDIKVTGSKGRNVGRFFYAFIQNYDSALFENNDVKGVSNGYAFHVGSESALATQSNQRFARAINNIVEDVEGAVATDGCYAFRIFGDQATVTGNDVKTVGSLSVGAEGQGIYLKVRRGLASKNQLWNAGRDQGGLCIKGKVLIEPVEPFAGHDVHVVDNVVFFDWDLSCRGMWLQADGEVVELNHVEGATITGIVTQWREHKRLSINRNRVYNTRGHKGIHVRLEGAAPRDVEIFENKIDGVDGSITAAPGSSPLAGIAVETRTAGTALVGLDIHKNRVKNLLRAGESRGIEVNTNADTSISRARITDNRVEGAEWAYRVGRGGGATFDDVRITGNGARDYTVGMVKSGSPGPTNLVEGENSWQARSAVIEEFTPRSRYGAGLWYSSPGSTVTTWLTVADRVTWCPFVVDERTAFDRLGVEITTAGAAGSVLRLGVYGDDGRGRPGALVLDADTVPADSTGAKEKTVALTLDPGFYWLATVPQLVSGTAPTVRANTTTSVPIGHSVEATSSAAARAGYGQSGISGALPATAVTTDGFANVARTLIRAA